MRGKLRGADLLLPLPWVVGVPAEEHLARERGGGLRQGAGVRAPLGGAGGSSPLDGAAGSPSTAAGGASVLVETLGNVQCAAAGFLGKSA